VSTFALAASLALAEPAASCRDGQTADTTVSALYDLVSVAPGESWDWERIGGLFLGHGLLVSILPRPGGALVSTTDFAGLRQNTEAGYRETGFSEREYRRETRVFGDVASIYSSFSIGLPARGPEPILRGLNHFQLVRREGCWRIVSNLSQMEGDGWTLPHALDPEHTSDAQ
jgi:hypothetical protein